MQLFLIVAGAGGLVLFGLPLLLVPVRWARLFRWPVPDDLRLVRYLGRSLGCTAVALGGVALIAGLRPDPPREILQMAVIAGGLLTAIHIVGALERAQPWTETAEIVFWAGLTAWGAALLF